MKYFVVRQNYEEKAMLDFYGNIDHFLILTASSTPATIRRKGTVAFP
jgi:hypothetical protein